MVVLSQVFTVFLHSRCAVSHVPGDNGLEVTFSVARRLCRFWVGDQIRAKSGLQGLMHADKLIVPRGAVVTWSITACCIITDLFHSLPRP